MRLRSGFSHYIPEQPISHVPDDVSSNVAIELNVKAGSHSDLTISPI